MKKIFVLLLLFLISVIAMPVSAALINTTLIISNTGLSEVNPGDVSSYLYTSPSGRMIVVTTLDPSNFISSLDNHFTFTLSDGSIITGTITKRSTSLFTGEMKIVFNGGTTSTLSYFNTLAPTYVDSSPSVSFVYLGTANSTSQYYLAALDTAKFTGLNNIINLFVPALHNYDLNTIADAYYTLSTRPSTKPIISVAVINNPAAGIQLYHQTYQTTLQEETDAAAGKNTVSSIYDSILTFLFNAITSLADYALLAIELFSYAKLLAGLIFAGGVFLTLVAAYTIIAAVLSIHDSDSLFKSIGKFWRYEMKLWNFFLRIFKDIKEMIKWW